MGSVVLMSSFYDWGKILIYIGIIMILAGFIIIRFDINFSWFGHLFGDIRIERDNFKLFIPLTSMLIITVILNLIIFLIKFLM